MPKSCEVCGAKLSSYNSGRTCFPCRKKQLERLEEKLSTLQGCRPEYIYLLLDKKYSQSKKPSTGKGR